MPVGYNFEWDLEKAEANLQKHGVSFAEAVTAFGDPLSMNMPDPDHSKGEQRFIVMKKNRKARPLGSDEDTMRPEYDFSKAVRGVTAARYAEGTNVVLLDPDVVEIFPNARAVNEALRTIARLTRTASRQRPRKRTA